MGSIVKRSSSWTDWRAAGRPDQIRYGDFKAGTVLVREHGGARHTVTVVAGGFAWNDTIYPSLSSIARAITGTAWNGPRFFGLTKANKREKNGPVQRGLTERMSPARAPVASTNLRTV